MSDDVMEQMFGRLGDKIDTNHKEIRITVAQILETQTEHGISLYGSKKDNVVGLETEMDRIKTSGKIFKWVVGLATGLIGAERFWSFIGWISHKQ